MNLILRSAAGLLVTLALVSIFMSARAADYQRTATYQDDVIVRCPDKDKATVQVLRSHSDVWSIGRENIDLRINRNTFARVQRYFPECVILVANVETYMQQAEAQMFPEEMAKEQAWVQDVMMATIPKCNFKQCEEALAEWENVFEQSQTWFKEYHPFDKVVNYYEDLADKNSELVRFVSSIGKTHEGRNMPAVHITASNNHNRKRFYMQCQIHAREWITGAVCMYLANHFVKSYKNPDDPDHSKVKHLLDNLEFVMIPIVNPDGMAYTWEKDRLWRKNRMDYKYLGAKCLGVDINRNFPLGFVHKNIAQTSCAEDFGGPDPLSENETKNIVKYFRKNAPIIGAIDWHSYGQLLLRPYGYTKESSPDEQFLYNMTKEMADLAHDESGKYYTAERSEQLYPCYGIAADWFYSNDAARKNKGYRPASVCIELRDKGTPYGFMLPPNQIIPTAKEVVPMVLHYAETMLKNPIKFNDPSKQPAFDEQEILSHL